jgi:hypothetical protein
MRRRRRLEESADSCMLNFGICTAIKYHSDDEIREDERGRACST